MQTEPSSATTTVVVMGVSGSGKTTVAHRLVDLLGWPFAEGDEFHPPANVEKMASGTPLTDEDRSPWLAAVASWIGEQEAAGASAIVTCSALRRAYREVLRRDHPSVWFVHVSSSPDALHGASRPARATTCRPRCWPASSRPLSNWNPTSRASRSAARVRPTRSPPGRSTPCVTSAASATPHVPELITVP